MKLDKFVINGGKRLDGEIEISGAKNALLALMPAALLAEGKTTLFNTPELNDIFTMIKLLNNIGVETEFKNNTLTLDTTNIVNRVAPYELVKKMRASVYVLGPLLAKYGYAKVSLPGGCAWGPRPINFHLEGLEKLGANIELEEGYIIAKAKQLKGTNITFDVPSVGATGNILMASVLAKGETTINNAAIEPEITNLTQALVKMGANINGIGTSSLIVEGVDELKPMELQTIPDRIEAGTMLIAGAITGGKVKIKNILPYYLNSLLYKLEDSGSKLTIDNESIEIDNKNFNIKATDISTSVFPGFPTDMQAQWTALMALSDGVATVTDTIYLDRFKHVPELQRLGADIYIKDNSAVVKGIDKLKGAKVMSTDLRASASLVLAALAAEGRTDVLRVYHLDRGYQRIEEKLKSLGADIERESGTEY